METLLFALGFIIAALGTWFLLYYLKTRKTLRLQHKIIMEFPVILTALAKDLEEAKAANKLEKKKEEEKGEENDKACDKAE